MTSARPRIGLALGSGSARGWSHIGVIKVLEQAGISPDIVCGTSVGAVVGAAYAAGQLERLEPWVKQLSWQAVLGLLDLHMGGGLIEGGKLVDFFRKHYDDQGIAALPKEFGCVATELGSGREIWLREGSVIDTVRASIALPGLFTPTVHDGRILIDGGLVNPVPISLCRAMGADIVIAVDLNWGLVGRHTRFSKTPKVPQSLPPPVTKGFLHTLFSRFTPALLKREDVVAGVVEIPSMLDVLSISLNIMQVRITNSRLAGEPADIIIRPRLSDIAALDFHRAEAAIIAGERAAQQALPFIEEVLA